MSNQPPQTSETKTIEVVVNGRPKRVPEGFSLDRILLFLEVDPGRVAVERNREIARKAAWGETIVEAGDHLEIVWFVGGGCW